jgi:predicted ATP-grasp superfamily ATP-dependent carboligase
MLLDAEMRQSLAGARALGRAGLRVALGVCESDVSAAPGLRSRWCRQPAVLPDFSSDTDGYVDSLIRFLDSCDVDVLIPAHDGSIEAVRGRRSEIEQRTAVALASEDALDIAVDKRLTLSRAEKLGIPTPRSLAVNSDDDLRRAIAEIGLPSVLKPARSWAAREGGGGRIASLPIRSMSQAYAAWHYISGHGITADLQQWVPGRRDAVSIFMADGEIWTRFAQTSHREYPRLGGVSVLSESIPPLADICQPAEALVREIGLEGYSMVEFRRDDQGRPVLMEVNPRLGGSLGLALRCGVDFPTLLHAWATGRSFQRIDSYRVGRRSRWLTGDVWTLKCAFDRGDRLDTPSPAAALARFIADFALRPAALDPFDILDPLPALVDWNENIIKPVSRRLRRVFVRPAARVEPSVPANG